MLDRGTNVERNRAVSGAVHPQRHVASEMAAVRLPSVFHDCHESGRELSRTRVDSHRRMPLKAALALILQAVYARTA